MINIKSFSKSKQSDGSASGGGGYATTSIAETAKKLATVHSIWGHSFNGTQDVTGDLEVPNLTTDENCIVEGNIRCKTKGEFLGDLEVTGTTNLDGITKLNGTTQTTNVEPQEDSKYNIGSTDKQYKNVYADNAWFTNLDITGSAHFKELVIDKIKAAGGQLIITPASFKIDKVGSEEEITDTTDIMALFSDTVKTQLFGDDTVSKITLQTLYQYRYDQDSGKELINEWSVGDCAVHMTFNIGEGIHTVVQNSYYRTVIVAVGTETVDGQEYNKIKIIKSYNTNGWRFGNVECGVGDEIVQLGNLSDETRQNAIVISAYNTALDNSVTAPAIVQYKGICDFDNLRNYKFNTIAANGNSFKGNFYTKSGDSYVEVSTDGILLEIKNGLKTTGIDIDSGTIVFNADVSDFFGNSLNLWGDNSNISVGDADKTTRVLIVNQAMPNYTDFGGGAIRSNATVSTEYEETPAEELLYTDYITLGSYTENSTIKVDRQIGYVSVSGTTATGSYMGGAGYVYNYQIGVKKILYTITQDSNDENVYNQIWESDIVYGTCPSDGNDPGDLLSFTYTAPSTSTYAVRYKVYFTEYDVTKYSGWSIKREYIAWISNTPTNIIEKSLITKNGLGVIKNVKNLIYFGTDETSTATSKYSSFHVKAGYTASSDQFYNSSIDVTPTAVNISGNVNIIRKIKEMSSSDDNTVLLYNADTWIINSVANNTLCLSALGATPQAGRRIRIYVRCDIASVGASRGQDIDTSGAGSKFVCNYGGKTQRLPMLWTNGQYYSDTNNCAESNKVSWNTGEVYEIEYISATMLLISRLQ